MAKRVDIHNSADRGDYKQVLKAILKGKFCPFCDEKKFAEYHQKPILYRGTHWFATDNNWPYEGTKRHFLLIHRKHIERIEDVSPKGMADLRTAIRALQKKSKFKDGSLFLRSGDPAITGGTVKHLHAQLLVGSRRTKNTTPIQVTLGFKKK